MDLSKIEDLTDDQKTKILQQHGLDVAVLRKKHDELLADADKIKAGKKMQDEQSRKKMVENASTLDDVKKLLADERESRTKLEQRILDGEKNRLRVENTRTVGDFVDKFVNTNVVDNGLVRGAIKDILSKRLAVRDGDIVELNGSEITGKTGGQVLSEFTANKEYAQHLIARNNNAKGGGSTGGNGGMNNPVTAKTMTRSEFDTTSPAQIAEFIRSGGDVVD